LQASGTEPAVAALRWPAIDIARGIAVAAMIVYHFAWDLSFFRLIATDIVAHPVWQLFARAIAASFLMLVGAGLVLAHGKGVRWRSFFKRLAVIAGAALLITLATSLAMPESYIFFGILHCIALASVLALPFLRAPGVVTLAAAAFAFAAPWLFTAPALDVPALDWLGLGARLPATNDYVPVFPWFGFVLVGVAATRLILRHAPRLGSPPRGRESRLRRGLAWSGRRSLIIYLAHQPVLLACLFLVARAVGPNAAAEEAAFLRSCVTSCVQKDGEKAVCDAGCGCAGERLKGQGLWPAMVGGEAAPAARELASRVARQCFEENRPGHPGAEPGQR
jgi:uncharacterized membrane protein